MSSKKYYTPFRKFDLQRKDAARRGIEFKLTFQQWLRIWLASGRWGQRGPRRGQYVMARFGDVGPYEEGNVKIIRSEENRAEQAPPTAEHLASIAKAARKTCRSKARRLVVSAANRGEGNAQAKLS